MLQKKDRVELLDDQELVERYRFSHDLNYIGKLYQRYSHLIAIFSRKYLHDIADCEDAVMEVFEIITNDLKKHDVKNFKNWLLTVTRNHCLKKLEKKRNLTKKEEELVKSAGEIMEFPLMQDHTDEEIKDKHLRTLDRGIQDLKDEQKQCIELFYLDSKSYKEIMEITGYSFNDIKSYIQNGKRNLRNYLTENG